MKLGAIRDYMKFREEFPLSDVATHFDISEEAARLALNYWINKGKVVAQGASCKSACGGGCGDSCSSTSTEQFRWIKSESRIQWF